MPEIGSHAQNAYQGHRSEIIAEFFFSGVGTVIPVPRPADTGIDFYCTLTEPAGKKAFSTHTFTVQVKSDTKPIKLESARSIQWLIGHPLPIFLCVVDKKTQVINIYHMLPRFYVWAHPPLPPAMTIVPGGGMKGEAVQWKQPEAFSVSAPIISLTFADIADKNKMERFKQVLTFWIGFEEENISRIRNHILQFSMPASYATNETKISGIIIQRITNAPAADVQLATSLLAPSLAWLAGQQWENDHFTSMLLLVLHRQLAANDNTDAGDVHHKLNTDCDQNEYIFQMADKLKGALTLLLGLPPKLLPIVCDRILAGMATKDLE